DKVALDRLEAVRDAVSRSMEKMDEEHEGDEGLLAEAKTDKGKLTAKSVKERLKDISADKDAAEERKVLEKYLDLIEEEATAGKKLKDAQRILDAKVAGRYRQLSETEIKSLAIHDKWLAAIAVAVQGELDRISQALTKRIKELAERYEKPLPILISDVETLSTRIDEHLKKMGFVWK
ncbi:MAG: hypothetical protein Q8O19_06270, partial [Rectinemataceae bacterium]|nr:hypothetical protein [Rectinemataceae bacterium]